MSITDIINGHINEILNKEENLSIKRMAICLKCPISKHTSLGLICDNTKWISKDDQVSLEAKPGYTRGCNCRLQAKTRLPHNHCIINRW